MPAAVYNIYVQWVFVVKTKNNDANQLVALHFDRIFAENMNGKCAISKVLLLVALQNHGNSWMGQNGDFSVPPANLPYWIRSYHLNCLQRVQRLLPACFISFHLSIAQHAFCTWSMRFIRVVVFISSFSCTSVREDTRVSIVKVGHFLKLIGNSSIYQIHCVPCNETTDRLAQMPEVINGDAVAFCSITRWIIATHL